MSFAPLLLPAPDWDDGIRMGAERQAVAARAFGGSHPRMDDSDPNHENIVGYVGEAAFARAFGFDVPPFGGRGDLGFEFRRLIERVDVRMDVKAACARPWFLPVKTTCLTKPLAAQVYVLLHCPWRAPHVAMVAWVRRRVVLSAPEIENCYEPGRRRTQLVIPGRAIERKQWENPAKLAEVLWDTNR